MSTRKPPPRGPMKTVSLEILNYFYIHEANDKYTYGIREKL